jgi:hypothetical protein
MKLLALATALALSTSVFAASNSSIVDLQYVPNAGTVFGSTNLGYINTSSRQFNGTSTDHYTYDGLLLQQSVGYGVLNNLFLSADLTYGKSKSESNGSEDSKSSGLGDVDLNGRFRVIDSENRLDILGELTISPGDYEVETDGDSNNYSGGHAIALGADYGVKKGAYQWSVNALLTHYFESKTNDKASDSKYTDDAHNGLNLGANLLTQLSESCFIKNSLGAQFREEHDDDDNNTTTGQSSYIVGSEFIHLLNKDISLKAGVNAFLGGSGYSYTVMFYSVGASYQF